MLFLFKSVFFYIFISVIVFIYLIYLSCKKYIEEFINEEKKVMEKNKNKQLEINSLQNKTYNTRIKEVELKTIHLDQILNEINYFYEQLSNLKDKIDILDQKIYDIEMNTIQ